MYSKILVPLDGSNVAECVLPHVEVLATSSNPISITFLYAVQPLEVIMTKPSFKKHIESEAKSAASNYLENLISTLKYHEMAERKVIVGKTAETIIDYAKKNKMDLIVMATHGLSGVKRWIRGSVAEKVLHKSKVPVWLIKAGDPEKGLFKNGNKIRFLVLLDGSSLAEKVLGHLVKLSKHFGEQSVDITLLRVCEVFFPPYTYPPPTPMNWEEYLEYETKRCQEICQTYLDKVAEKLQKEGLSIKTEVPTGNAAEIIVDYTNKSEFDLVIMATHGRTGLRKWALGSVADKVLTGISNPIFLVRSR
jgi:nucleotide-binding universal stress UspA family protein